MVSPYCTGDLVRSYVRVPGTGSEKSAKPLFCDLGRASILAATVSVPQNLPSATNVLIQTPSVTPIPKNQQRKRPRTEEKENSPDSSSAPKVIRIEASSAPLYFNIHYMCPLDKGTKILNLHGQKCIVSKVANLAKYCEPAYRRDGSIVKPQILFSTTSLVGRTVASQVYSMACSKDVAFTKDGAMIAPMGYNIHNIEASSKCKQSLVKNDLMTMAAVRIPNAVVEKLQGQNEQLRKENELLKKQVSLFKQLLRNPQRLKSVLSRLRMNNL